MGAPRHHAAPLGTAFLSERLGLRYREMDPRAILCVVLLGRGVAVLAITFGGHSQKLARVGEVERPLHSLGPH